MFAMIIIVIVVIASRGSWKHIQFMLLMALQLVIMLLRM